MFYNSSLYALNKMPVFQRAFRTLMQITGGSGSGSGGGSGSGSGGGSGGTTNSNLLDLGPIYGTLHTWGFHNFIYVVAGGLIFVALMWAFGGLKQSWGPLAIKFGTGLIVAFIIFLAIPQILGFVLGAYDIVTGSNYQIDPNSLNGNGTTGSSGSSS